MRHSTSLPLLILMTLMIVMAGMNSVTDLLHDAGNSDVAGTCEYCDLTNPPAWVPPAALSVPALLLDLSPESLLPLLIPAAQIAD